MRRRVQRSRVGHDRWLVSYADFITLLFAFFVVLYAFARADRKKQVAVAQAIDTAFHAMGSFPKSAAAPAATASSAPPSVPAVQEFLLSAQIRNDLARMQHDLSLNLAGPIAAHSVSLEMGPDGLVISLREAGFFRSGSALPTAAALPVLRVIADRINQTPYNLRVEGHTDNAPIHNAEFDSNWELSAARATRIARLILEMKTIPPDRISAAGYAQYHPVAGNDTAEGRARNRRVDLVVLPRVEFGSAEPDPAAHSGPWRRITDGD